MKGRVTSPTSHDHGELNQQWNVTVTWMTLWSGHGMTSSQHTYRHFVTLNLFLKHLRQCVNLKSGSVWPVSSSGTCANTKWELMVILWLNHWNTSWWRVCTFKKHPDHFPQPGTDIPPWEPLLAYYSDSLPQRGNGSAACSLSGNVLDYCSSFETEGCDWPHDHLRKEEKSPYGKCMDCT